MARVTFSTAAWSLSSSRSGRNRSINSYRRIGRSPPLSGLAALVACAIGGAAERSPSRGTTSIVGGQREYAVPTTPIATREGGTLYLATDWLHPRGTQCQPTRF